MFMTSAKTAADYCGQIAERLRAKPGMWTRGMLHGRGDDGGETHCTVGLIDRFVPEELRADALTLVAAATGMPGNPLDAFGSIRAKLECWNDSCYRRVDDVICVFEHAARITPSGARALLGMSCVVPDWNAISMQYFACATEIMAEAAKKELCHAAV